MNVETISYCVTILEATANVLQFLQKNQEILAIKLVDFFYKRNNKDIYNE